MDDDERDAIPEPATRQGSRPRVSQPRAAVRQGLGGGDGEARWTGSNVGDGDRSGDGGARWTGGNIVGAGDGAAEDDRR